MKRYIAELIGTFVLVFGGCGSAVLAGDKIGFPWNSTGVWPVAACNGLRSGSNFQDVMSTPR
jgi:glycerol uptake facilitator-like aquaporin